MPSIFDALKNKESRDPLFFARAGNFREQREKPLDCKDCPFYKHPYAWEEKPDLDRQTGEVLPTDVLVIIPNPTMADVAEEGRANYIQPFGVAGRSKRGQGSKSWFLYRKVINNLKRTRSVNIKTVYAVPCKGKGQTPMKVGHYCGKHYLQRKVLLYKPKVILCLGQLAAKSLGFKFKRMLNIRGSIDTYEHVAGSIPIVFSYDPDYYFFPKQEYKALERFICDMDKAVKIAVGGGFDFVDHEEMREKFEYPSSPRQIELFVEELLDRYEEKKFVLAFDIETTGLWHWYDQAHLQKIHTAEGLTAADLAKYRAENNGEAHPKEVMPAEILAISLAWGPENAAAFRTRDLPQKTWDTIAKLFASDIPKVAHNGKFDMTYLLGVQGIRVNNLIGDTLLNQHLIDENRSGYVHGEYSLKKLVWDYEPEFGGYEKVGSIYENIANLGNLSSEELLKMLYYAALDSLITWRIHRTQFFELNDVKPNSCPATKVVKTKRYLFAKKQMTRASQTISELEVHGMRLDMEHLYEMRKQANRLLAREESNVNNVLAMVGEVGMNLKSTPQLEKLLYDKLELPVLKETKGGKRSTAATVLEELEEHDQTGLVKSMLRIKKLTKLVGSFLDSWEALAKGDRIYPFVNLDGTKTGRLSMRDPNIQQVPDKDKYGEIAVAYGLPWDYFNLKTLFIPDEGHTLIAADFSQMEIRVLAAYCAEGALSKLLREDGKDMHSMITSQVHGLDYDLVETARNDKKHPRHMEMKLLRSQTKAVTFTITYGGTEYTLFERDGLPQEEGKKLFDRFYSQFPEVKDYIDRTHAMARQTYWVDTMFHRRRHFPILKYTYYNRALRQAQNSRIQSTASDVCLLAVIRLQEVLKTIGGRVLTTVHDSIVSQVPTDRLEEGLRLYKQVMLEEPAANYKWLTVPLKIDLDVGTSWGKTTEVPVDEARWSEVLAPFRT